jgi:hypothetical protein
MLRPYKIVRHGYVARASRYPVGAIRPTRNAAGMTFTASRGGGELSDDARRLSLFGTLDRPRPCSLVQSLRGAPDQTLRLSIQ